MRDSDNTWKRLLDICDDLNRHGIAAVPRVGDASSIVLYAPDIFRPGGSAANSRPIPVAMVSLEREDLERDDFREIALTRVIEVLRRSRVGCGGAR